ncbi:hypothetical protein [Streptomyces parvulus]|uniref:hypothetical protein n=1 Tax=Streptomyces parvulus TaxID=146923 RepID=UPI00370056CA
MREPDRSGTYGSASDHGQVYQAGANQYVTHIHVAEARSRTAHEARRRADVVVQALTRAVGEWAARCRELEEQVRLARTEGRAEAQLEFAQRLSDAELRVERAQTTMRQAEAERARAEALLAQAQEELARRRREAERDAEREHSALPVPENTAPSPERQDTEQFSALMERAEAELGVVRQELRLLGEELDGETAEVVRGEWSERLDGGREEQAAGAITDEPGGDADPPTRTTAPAKRPSLPGPPRRLRIGAACLAWQVPATVPMLVVTANRAVYRADGRVVDQVLFTAGSVLAGALALLTTSVFMVLLSDMLLSRASEQKRDVQGIGIAMVVLLVLFVAAFFTPLTWPGPAGSWGATLASFVGLA